MYYNQKQLELLSKELVNKFDDLAKHFDIDYSEEHKTYSMACPIHCGDNLQSVQIYKDNGHWKCYSWQCEKYFIDTMVGFMRGLLSSRECGWRHDKDKMVSFSDTLEFCTKFLNKQMPDIKEDKTQSEKQQFVSNIKSLNGKPTSCNITRYEIKKKLDIPANYYIQRGFTTQVLEKFDVGLCSTPNKPMSNRIVVPVYDDDGKYMVGCSGRSTYNQCDKCKQWHDISQQCPPNNVKIPKWKHSSGFTSSYHLYNYWNSKTYIQTTGVACLVESPGNVWKLDEAGIYNTVGLFGTALSDGQKMVLDSSGALSLILLLDNDDAGHKGTENIIEQCQRLYHIQSVKLQKNDVGDMSIDEINTDIKPVVDKAIQELNL